jgi:PAS domain S-box-containing protein
MPLSPEESRALASFTAERTSDGLFCFDIQGKILFANEAAARTLGCPVSLLTGRDVFGIAPEMNPALWKELWKEIHNNTSFAFEFMFVVGERQVQVDITVHYLEPASRPLACAFFRDIEERKRLQNQQQEFVSTASHELRSPMTIIREGIAQVLDGLRGDLNDSQRRALSLALTGIDRLGRIIDELLDMSKIESGRITLRRERLDLAALTREVGGSFQGLAHDRGLDLRVTTPAGPVILFADRDRLIQVLTNLITNAFKFTEKGHIQISVSAKDGEIECSVSDSGIGLAAADVDKIFNKFEQLEQTSFTGEKGTGLGLSISRGIIELHKGRIWAASPGPGKGSSLSFVIPQQSGRDVFQEQLSVMLRDVMRRGGSLSTVIFRIDPVGSEPIAESQILSMLTGLGNLIRQESGRATDLMVKDVDAVYLALQSMVKREGARVADRIVAAFEANLVREKLQSRFRLTYTITGFPDEARDEEAYLSHVFDRKAA